MTPTTDTTSHVRRARAGERESITWLVARLSPLLLAQAGYRLGSELRRSKEPDDLVAEVWLIALPKLASLRESVRMTPVLLRFLSSVLVHRVNRLIRSRIRGDVTRRDRDIGLDELAGDTAGALTRIVQRERDARVLKLLDLLDPTDREIVVLRAIEQNDLATVASLLDMQPNTVAQRYRRAIGKLRHALPESVFAELK